MVTPTAIGFEASGNHQTDIAFRTILDLDRFSGDSRNISYIPEQEQIINLSK